MITKAEAQIASMFHHVTLTNVDGTPQRFRVNGKCKTWVTRPTEFSVPVKRGMYEHGYVTHENAYNFILGR